MIKLNHVEAWARSDFDTAVREFTTQITDSSFDWDSEAGETWGTINQRGSIAVLVSCRAALAFTQVPLTAPATLASMQIFHVHSINVPLVIPSDEVIALLAGGQLTTQGENMSVADLYWLTV